MVRPRSFESVVAGVGRSLSLRRSRGLLSRVRETAVAVDTFDAAMRARSDGDLHGLRTVLRARLDHGESLDSLLPEAFAAVREAAWRALGQRHRDVQILGAIALHHGAVVEMKTGEGKTLTATAPAYLHAMTGGGVHILTGDDYLAERDARWMTPVYRLLGLECGLLVEAGTTARRAAYAADVTYGTYTEFCYDYLRDNLATKSDDVVQRGHRLAIVDEADLVMIDNARATPAISTSRDDSEEVFDHAVLAGVVRRLRPGEDYNVDQHQRQVTLTDAGIARAEGLLGIAELYQERNGDLLRELNNALIAKEIFQRGRDYLVEDGRISIVDEHTGRVQRGHVAAPGVQQALAAKEGLRTESTEALAVSTVRDYLRRYERLSAMTGVAASDSEAYERVYGLAFVAIPPHRPIVRVDRPVAVYSNEPFRMAALTREVVTRTAAGQPVLIGTGSIEHSERISAVLTEAGVVHRVLNAKHHADEAQIIAQAGRRGAVTIVTKMAGRGVDIRLGGDSPEEHDEVIAAGGLFVLGTDVYQTRRLELHLRGRSGRQGDPGESAFFLTLEDEIFQAVLGTGLAKKFVTRLIDGEEVPFDNSGISRVLERALDRRSAAESKRLIQLVAYDAVLDEQREALYRRRRAALEGANLRDHTRGIIDQLVDRYVARAEREQQQFDELRTSLVSFYQVDIDAAEAHRGPSGWDYHRLGGLLRADAQRAYDRREAQLGELYPEAEPGIVARKLERRVTLAAIDQTWRQHLRAMEDLLAGSALHRLAGRDQLTAYRRDATDLFNSTLQQIDEQIVRYLFNLEL